MARIIIFGSGSTGRDLLKVKSTVDDVLFFIDNDSNQWGMTIDGIKIESPEIMRNMKDYDEIYLASITGIQAMKEQLNELGVEEHKVKVTDNVNISVMARENFLKNLSEIINNEGLEGAVAEAGVFRGDFASRINYYFDKRKCYLFDTFTGFDSRDFAYELENTSLVDGYLSATSVDLVLSRMPNSKNVIICKGYFPESAENIDDHFVFTNLDLDLYKPTFEGLKYFYPKLVRGGVILIHDYFCMNYPGVKKAVDEFINIECKVIKFPIGDDLSIALMKI